MDIKVVPLVILMFIIGCISQKPIESDNSSTKLVPIPSSKQRPGDPEKGRKYLLEGDYLDSGIPAEIMSKLGMTPNMDNYLEREGKNANLPPQFTHTQAANGTEIIAPNCMAEPRSARIFSSGMFR